MLQASTKKLRDRLLDGLAARDVLRAEEGRVLGIFPTRRWPAAHEAQVRELIMIALAHGTTPDHRAAALIALLSGVDAAHKVVDHAALGVDRKTIKKRAKEVRETAWAAGAVVKAVEAVQAAVTAAIVASTAATAGSSG